MTARIRIFGLADGRLSVFDGQWLAEYDPERPGVDPTGLPMLAHIVCTKDRDEAMVFDSGAEAFAAYTRASKRLGLRWDGNPHRPLTAFSVEVIPDGVAPEAAAGLVVDLNQGVIE